MYFLAAFFIIGLLGSTPSVLAFDCLDEDAAWKSEITKCFEHGETGMLSNANYACSNTDALKSAVSCFLGIARHCLISMWEDPAILPDTNTLTNGVVYLCDHFADVDAECFQGTLPTIGKCSQRKAHAAISGSSDQSFRFRVCALLDAIEDCARQQLGVCTRRTKEIVVNLFPYITPAACSGDSRNNEAGRQRETGVEPWSEDYQNASAGVSSCVFLLLAALLAAICRY